MARRVLRLDNKSGGGKEGGGRPVSRPDVEDIGEQMAAPSALQKARYADLLRSPHLLSRIFDIAEDAIISIDEAQNIVMFNQGAEKIFGYAPGEVLGQPLDMLIPTRFGVSHRRHVRDFGESPVAARSMGDRGQIEGRRKDGTEFPADASISKVDLEGVRIYSVILRDMSEHRKAEETLKAALVEKEVLLKEIHHRVKNNLQVVSSLLSLQSRGVQDDATRQLFKESQNRVQSMALIHEQLYQSKSLSAFDFPEYVRLLAGHLFRSYQVSASRIELDTNIANVQLGIDMAVPCGLIINELVSNALKHAFPGGSAGKIQVKLTGKRGTASLSIQDNGTGLPEEIGLLNSETLGLRLVRSLVTQLEGEVRIERSQGTEIRIDFPVPDTGEDREN